MPDPDRTPPTPEERAQLLRQRIGGYIVTGMRGVAEKLVCLEIRAAEQAAVERRDREWRNQLGVDMEESEGARLLCTDLKLMRKHLREQRDEKVCQIAAARALEEAAEADDLVHLVHRLWLECEFTDHVTFIDDATPMLREWFKARAAQIENEEE